MNYEKFWSQFFSRDSIFYWAMRSFKPRRNHYTTLFESGMYPHFALYHFRSQREVDEWMRSWVE